MKRYFIIFLLTLATTVISHQGISQNLGIYKGGSSVFLNNSYINSTQNPSLEQVFTSMNYFSQFFVRKGQITLKTDFGGNYVYGTGTSGKNFDFDIHFRIKLFDASTTLIADLQRTISIDNSSPEGLFYLNLQDYIDPTNTDNGLKFETAKIEDVSITGTYDLSFDPANSLRLMLDYVLEYGISADQGNSNITLNPVQVPPVGSKIHHFTWSSTVPYPNYQVQIARLFNKNPNNIYDEKDIDIVDQAINWDEALTLETENADQEIYLSMSEGNGAFAWRVRPIGTFYEGGIANSKNYGDWTSSNLNGITQLNFNNSQPSFLFWCTDVDDNRNYIYSRTFTEGNNISEKVTYANGLLQTRQWQAYLKSSDSKITMQAIIDNSGRPAMKTVPIPTLGPLGGYKEGFMLIDGTNDLYNATHFDMDQNYKNPLQNKEINGFDYYSNSNSIITIPDAEKYSYSRTIYLNDGSGRIQEQSGVGKVHMIGSQSLGMGRTIRTEYGTATQGELDNMFGSEAPVSSSVFKTITKDENNVASVTFTNKEGQVIATALTFDETAQDEVVEKLAGEDTEGALQDVVDNLTTNIKNNSEFVSSKKLVILSETPLTINYSIATTVLENLCTDVELNCGYAVKVLIHNLDDGPPVIIGPVTLQCSNALVTCSGTAMSTDFGVTQPVNLPPGNYLIEKVLFKESAANVTVTLAMDRIKQQIEPIANWITSTLNQVNCEEELIIFYNDLNHFVTEFNLMTNSLNPHTINFNCTGCSGSSMTFDGLTFMKYFDPGQFHLQLDIPPNSLPFTTSSLNFPDKILISTPCCNDMEVPVTYTPPFKCPTLDQLHDLKATLDNSTATSPLMADYLINEDLLMDPNHLSGAPGDYFLPDFEGYAISMIKQCYDGHPAWPTPQDALDKAKEVLYSNMIGWHRPGVFNMMIYHMLTDQYNCENLGSCSSQSPVSCTYVSPTPVPTNGYNTDCEPGADPIYPCSHYTCKDLAKCWRAIVLMLMNANCPEEGFAISADGIDGKISDGFDEQNKGDETKHDKHADDNFHVNIPNPFGWFMEKLMSRRLRDIQDVSSGNNGAQTVPPPPPNFNLVEQFLECTGYQFADILNSNQNTVVNSFETQDDPGNPFSNDNCFISLDYDFDSNINNGHYNPDYFFNNIITASCPTCSTCTSCTTLFNSYPTNINDWQLMDTYSGASQATFELNKLGRKFKNVKNPIYAFKYFEYEYGSHNDLEIMNCFRDPNICYISGTQVPCCTPDPCYFCGIGEVNCTSTKANWSCGQRYTWFSIIKNYTNTEELPGSNAPSGFTCTELSAAHQWYTNPASNVYELTAGLPSNQVEHENLMGALLDPVSIAEYRAVDMRNQCWTGCGSEARKGEFKRKLIEMFTERCYIIGGCKLTEDDNIVPEEDIDFLVEKLAEQCSTQCWITTYSCEDRLCRMLNTPSSVTGSLNQEAELRFGVGGDLGGPNGSTNYPSSLNNQTMTLYQENNGPFPNAEYTLWLQAKDWDFDMDIVSKCNKVDFDNNEASYDASLPLDDVYIFNATANEYEIQTFDILGCPEQANTPNSDLPNTAIPKSEYAVDLSNGPLDGDKAGQVGEPVKSNKIGLILQTPF